MYTEYRVGNMLTKEQINEAVQRQNKFTGIQLEKLRKTYELSQTEVAKSLSLVGNQISAIEKGHKSADQRKLVALAKLYNVTIDFIVTGNKDGLSPSAKATIDGSAWFA